MKFFLKILGALFSYFLAKIGDRTATNFARPPAFLGGRL